MICVLSQSALEDTTDAVMDWLRAWRVPCIRINGGDIDCAGGPTVSISSAGARVQLTIDGAAIDLGSIKAVWYRRWAFNNQHRSAGLFANPSHATAENLYAAYSHLNGELRVVSSFLFAMMESAVWLGRPSTSTPNKLRALKLAAEAGVDIPDTFITTDAGPLRDFIQKHGEVIAKPASDTLNFNFDDRMFAVYTSVASDPSITDPWKGSFPSLFQEKLAKKYEIRTFYLDGSFYSMAMFTQQKESTQVDFRRYSLRDPARTVPYSLPSEVEARLRVLMQGLDLDTGSIDLVRTTDGRYVFLEVNPVGQFGMVSQPCNYFLERRVARALVERSNGIAKTA
ncbi:MAG TPA: grasp-with-spasm system ATP-grasp peptide maturase [Blastocatellia bacterium]|nr:grasp-with-spasm system ATP-grasp peptide maturase [Blastocatellia bacterium]